jgi:hypothetical protein
VEDLQLSLTAMNMKPMDIYVEFRTFFLVMMENGLIAAQEYFSEMKELIMWQAMHSL